MYEYPKELDIEEIDSSRIVVDAKLNKLDPLSVKLAIYEKASELWQSSPEIEFRVDKDVSLYMYVKIKDPGKRKSIKDLLKPCIDGLEPILGRSDNANPLPMNEIKGRRFSPRDERILDISMNVRGAVGNNITIGLNATDKLKLL